MNRNDESSVMLPIVFPEKGRNKRIMNIELDPAYGGMPGDAAVTLRVEMHEHVCSFRTVTHLVMAAQFAPGSVVYNQIVNTQEPESAVRIADMYMSERRPDWPLVSRDVMKGAQLCKFSQNPVLASVLFETGQRPLQHRTDSSLGDVMQAVREELRKEWGDTGSIAPRVLLHPDRELMLPVRGLLLNKEVKTAQAAQHGAVVLRDKEGKVRFKETLAYNVKRVFHLGEVPTVAIDEQGQLLFGFVERDNVTLFQKMLQNKGYAFFVKGVSTVGVVHG